MLRIIYRVCCGMDVHKSFVVACIASTNEQGVTTYKSKRFSTFTGDLRRCVDWLSENKCKDVCMESTGKYWIPVYNILEPTCNIVLTHPKYVKAIRGKKTDKRDAKWIADIFKHDLVAGSFIPPAAEPIGDKVGEYIRENGRDKIRPIVVGEIAAAESRPICQWFESIPLGEEKIRQLTEKIYIRLAEKKAGELSEKFHVDQIVEEKVNQMDVLEVEEVLLGIMKKELNAVVNLGAVIGFVIGLLNLLF